MQNENSVIQIKSITMSKEGNLAVDNILIEQVMSFNYLGTKVSSSGNLTD